MPDEAGASGAGDFHLYIIRCADDTLYTGIACDVERRLQNHAGGKNGAKYLRGRGPLELVFSARVGGRGEAQRLESRVKRLSREDKLALVGGRLSLYELDQASASSDG
jgi:putative endonuclease